MILDKAEIKKIDWSKHLATVSVSGGKEYDVPLQFFGSMKFNKDDYKKFDILLVGNTYNDCVGILVYKSVIQEFVEGGKL